MFLPYEERKLAEPERRLTQSAAPLQEEEEEEEEEEDVFQFCGSVSPSPDKRSWAETPKETIEEDPRHFSQNKRIYSPKSPNVPKGIELRDESRPTRLAVMPRAAGRS
ncbi:hypothetical protein EYF80_028803 [Liparis tanakae]|uniref:Uncharacterized protein n=1 Tax=Liparis tanakae TaxID=230148 RepID=A0A4Z2H701_9TELE|nr:hypothetical protein EYF80_028803 [Liparis tanakae]